MDTEILWFFIGLTFILLGGYLLYVQYICPFQINDYDNKLIDLSGKMNAINCNVPQLEGSYNLIRCKELNYEYNKLVIERNGLHCVGENSYIHKFSNWIVSEFITKTN